MVTLLSLSTLSANTGHTGPEPANLLSQPHLSWIICWLTPDTFMSLTRRLPTIALPNGLRPPILQVPIVDQLNPVQEQTLPNWPHMFSQSSDAPAGNIYGSVPKSLKCRLHACIGSAIKGTKMVLIRRQQVRMKAALFLRPKEKKIGRISRNPVMYKNATNDVTRMKLTESFQKMKRHELF